MPTRARKPRGRGKGRIRQTASGRYQASRVLVPGERAVPAPYMFDTWLDADRWLAKHGAEPNIKVVDDESLAAYADAWLARRSVKLKPRTVSGYRALLRDHVLPELGEYRLSRLTPSVVNGWYDRLPMGTATQARAYELLATVMNAAVRDDLVEKSPCRVEGGSTYTRASKTVVADEDVLTSIEDAMPDRLKAMIVLASWCALRFGELTELRRRDVVLKADHTAGRVYVTRGVVRDSGKYIVGSPKSKAGVRPVPIPPFKVRSIAEHLDRHVAPGEDALLFPAGCLDCPPGGHRKGCRGTIDPLKHLAPSTFYAAFYPARAAAGRPDLRLHDLRHTGARLAARSGATLAELKQRLGHSTTTAAMLYQQTAEGDADALAARMSAAATKG